MLKDVTLSRRRLLQGGAAMAGLATAPALAKGPMLGTQAPYFYRFKLGNAEATVVSDGPLPLGDPTQAFLGLSKDEIGRQLSSNFLPLANAVLEQNALIVNTGSHLVLFDTGMGTREGLRPDHGQAAQQHEAGRHRPEGHRRGGDEPRVTSTTSAATSATTARAISRMRSSISSSRISNTGPTRSSRAGR